MCSGGNCGGSLEEEETSDRQEDRSGREDVEVGTRGIYRCGQGASRIGPKELAQRRVWGLKLHRKYISLEDSPLPALLPPLV